MFKTLKGNLPSYLRECFTARDIGYNVRNSEMKLNLPKPRTNYMKRSFCYSGAQMWNSLPEELRMLDSFPQFRRAINQLYKQ